MFEYTKVDGIMIGRGALGAPWLIGDIKKQLNGEEVKEISNKDKLEIIKEHLDLAVKDKGEYIAIREMRKHICWYIKNLKDSSKIREKINRIENIGELKACLDEYFMSL